MEIFYNASPLWTSIRYKLYCAKNIIIRDGINSLRLTGSVKKRVSLLHVPWNKIQFATIFNATFFIILRAYAEIATDDGASCWAQ